MGGRGGGGAEPSAGGDQVWTGGFPAARGGHQEPGDPHTRFPAARVESTPFPHGTHTGAGPESGARRTLPQPAGVPPQPAAAPRPAPPQSCVPRANTLRGIAQRLRAPSSPRGPERSEGRTRGGGGATGPRRPGTHAPTPVAGGISPRVQDGPAVGRADPHAGRTCWPRPGPRCQSLTQIASSSSSHADPARAIPAAAALGRLRSPLGLPRPQLRRVQMPPPLPNGTPPPSSRCHVCQSMRTRRGEASRKKCLLGAVVCSRAGL